MKRVAIIGGGAAGMFCAANIDPQTETVLFEASDALMRKVLLSGGGRCNFSNENIDTRNPNEFYPRGVFARRNSGRSSRKIRSGSLRLGKALRRTTKI